MKNKDTNGIELKLTPELKATLSKLAKLKSEPESKVIERLLIEESKRYGLLEARGR